MFVDKVKIFIKAGDGGNGCASFFTAKYIANGGPNGGDGGRGGDMIFVADPQKSTLIDFYYTKHFRAGNGGKGEPANRAGKNGSDVRVSVPPGTRVSDTEGRLLCDLFYSGQEYKALAGGTGGFGNTHFATAKRQAPAFSQLGQKGGEAELVLELKYIADVGIVGFPNVGKSTLLAGISDAKPKIANYHFTTLSPNLGVVKYYDDSFVAADIPGLIEGASTGAGLGHGFLRHIERTRMLLHVVDIAGSEGRDPAADYKTINAELKNYNQKLSGLPQVIALNKTDLLTQDELEKAIKKFKKFVKNSNIVMISSATGAGIKPLLDAVYAILKTLPKPEPEIVELPAIKTVSPPFSIKMDGKTYVLSGRLIDNLARNVVLFDPESMAYFQQCLNKYGINKALKEYGAQEGDIVRLLDTEFEFYE
ncbi:MAG: GTPase ObgE [Firmicutes bacterium]|nr:GTPase ObgE [Bacillota bacterium]